MAKSVKQTSTGKLKLH